MSNNDSRLALIVGDLEESKLSSECLENVTSKVKDYYASFAEKTVAAKPARINQKTVLVPVDHYKKINGYDNFIGHKEVVLTFDDGPVFNNTAYIVELLKKWDIKSMFFFVGKRLGLQAELQQAKDIKALGHTIATHSHTHAGMKTTYKKLGLAGLKAEIIDNHNQADKLLEGISPYFRFPGGTANAEIDAIVNGWGLSIWHWSIDSLDFNTPNPDDIVKRVITELEKKQRGVLLFHDIHRQTSLAMPEILKYLADNNYTIILPVEK